MQETNVISIKQVKDAIQRSGYLLEQRVEPVLFKEGYYVETNPVFQDPDTEKAREIDISALSAWRIYGKEYGFIFPTLICECENNALPIVFFTKEIFLPSLCREDIKTSGIPVKFWKEDEYESFADFTGLERFHHYCAEEIATQYCTFEFTKKGRQDGKWLATHEEKQHQTFEKLLKALDYEIARHFDAWAPPNTINEEQVDIKVYYPLLILQGDLYSAYLRNKRLSLKKSKHVRFRKQFISPSKTEPETYQIAVITEDYLPSYLKIIDSELKKMTKILQRKKSRVLLSIEKIVDETKKAKGEPESYRGYLEF
jgi:hypothetical protein